MINQLKSKYIKTPLEKEIYKLLIEKRNHEDSAIGVLHMLRTEEKQKQILDYIKSGKSISEVILKAVTMSDI